MFMILEVTTVVTNVGLYSSRNVTTSLFKSFRKISYLGNNINRFTLRLAHEKLHSICIHSPIPGSHFEFMERKCNINHTPKFQSFNLFIFSLANNRNLYRVKTNYACSNAL